MSKSSTYFLFGNNEQGSYTIYEPFIEEIIKIVILIYLLLINKAGLKHKKNYKFKNANTNKKI